MIEIDRESALKNSANKALNNYVESLDSETLSKIGAARRRALQKYNRPKYGVFSRLGLSAGGLVVAGFALFVVMKRRYYSPSKTNGKNFRNIVGTI